MKIKLILIVFSFIFALFATSSYAKDGLNDGERLIINASTQPVNQPHFDANENENESSTSGSENEKHFSPRPDSTGSGERKEKLTEVKLKICEDRQSTIKDRQDKLMVLVSQMTGKFDGIVKRVSDFYMNKIFPTGKTLSNYDALLSDIDAKKATVTSDISKAQTDISGFSCTGDNPKGSLDQFRTDMQAVKSALQDYRQSVKNLLVAVRTLVGDVESEHKSPSPSASSSPVATASPSI